MTEDVATLSKARRARLAADWPVETPELKAKREAGKALGAYDDTRCLWCSPKFQFLDGELIPETSEVLKILRIAGCQGPGGWGEIEWFLSPHVLLDDLSPSEVLIRDPTAVLKAVRAQFVEDDDSGGF